MRSSRCVAVLLAAGAASAQDSGAGSREWSSDTSGGVCPGAKVVLKNDGTGVEVSRVRKTDGRYLFDYVDPGTYTVTRRDGRLQDRRPEERLVQQRGDVTVDLTLEVGGMRRRSRSPIARGRAVQHGQPAT